MKTEKKLPQPNEADRPPNNPRPAAKEGEPAPFR